METPGKNPEVKGQGDPLFNAYLKEWDGVGVHEYGDKNPQSVESKRHGDPLLAQMLKYNEYTKNKWQWNQIHPL